MVEEPRMRLSPNAADEMGAAAFAPGGRAITLAAAGVWSVAGALALAIANQNAPLVDASSWCGVTGMSPLALGHCALCWSGLAALVGGLAGLARGLRAPRV
jgi:hypothetical protein